MLLNKTAPIKLQVHQSTLTADNPGPNTHSSYWLKYINPPHEHSRWEPTEITRMEKGRKFVDKEKATKAVT